MSTEDQQGTRDDQPSAPREKRIGKAVPIRIKFHDSGVGLPAYTLNITSKGARISGFGSNKITKCGEIVEIEKGGSKYVCRVRWVGIDGSHREGQIGVVHEGKGSFFGVAALDERNPDPVQSKGRRAKKLQTTPPSHGVESKTSRLSKLAAPYLKPSTSGYRQIVLVLAFGALFVGALSLRSIKKPADKSAGHEVAMQVNPQDAQQIHYLQNWRIVSPMELDPDGVEWLKSEGQEPRGALPFDIVGNNTASGSAYLFAPASGERSRRRIVVLSNNALRYDTVFPKVAIVAVVPRARLLEVAWEGDSREAQPSGDGLLVVQDEENPKSGLVLFMSSERLQARVSSNFHSIHLH